MNKLCCMIIADLFFLQILCAQKEDVNWVFGLGCGINFENPAEPMIFLSNSANLEASASISDTFGQLQFYLANDVLLNRHNDTLVDGSGFSNPGTYAGGVVILPFFKGSHLYHIFHVGEKDHVGLGWGYERLYHSVVDMTIANGRGGVLVKSDLLFDEVINEGLSAVKHGDGISWWLTTRENGDESGTGCSNRYFKFLIQEESVSGPFVQEIGISDCIRDYPAGRAKFFSKGDRMIYIDYFDKLAELYDFDRCTGELSNPILLGMELTPYGAEVSPDGRYLYIVDIDNPGFSTNLYQYDLLSENISASKQTIALSPTGDEPLGQILLAPDGKIYLSSGPSWIWPQYISVINHPNLQGSLCGFEPLSFYLGEDALTFGDLPNMPNYQLPALDGEPCITALYNLERTGSDLYIYPNPVFNDLHVENLSDECWISVYDLLGTELLSTHTSHATEIIDVSGLDNGMYVLVFHNKAGMIHAERFVKMGY